MECWGKAITRDSPLADTAEGRRILGRIEAFENWSAENDVALDPFLTRYDVHSTIRETTQRIVRLPTMALAEYENGSLAYVTPHAGDEIETVTQRLETLENGS